MVLTGLALLLTLIDTFTAKSRILDEAGSFAKSIKISVTPQIGFFFIAIGLIVAIAVMVYEEFFMKKAK